MNGTMENSPVVSTNNLLVERHPLEPFLPSHARLLMLGSFPPPRKRWSIDFFYPNLQNDMWRIFGLHFFGDKQYFVDEEKRRFQKEKLVEFLQQKGIALYDTATAICRLQENASDKFLHIVEATDIHQLLHQLPLCKAIAATGQLATEQLCQTLQATAIPSVGQHIPVKLADGRELSLYRMPSSSRAYPLPIEKKTIYYSAMFNELFNTPSFG